MSAKDVITSKYRLMIWLAGPPEDVTITINDLLHDYKVLSTEWRNVGTSIYACVILVHNSTQQGNVIRPGVSPFQRGM